MVNRLLLTALLNGIVIFGVGNAQVVSPVSPVPSASQPAPPPAATSSGAASLTSAVPKAAPPKSAPPKSPASVPASSPVSSPPLSAPSSPSGTPTSGSLTQSTATTSSNGGGSISATPTTVAPDVLLRVPTIGVKRIELDVDNLSADINLNANVASLVTVNAGVALSVQKVNLTISDVGAELELIVRLGHLVDIVNRVFKSLDLNPLIIGVLNNVTSLVETAVGAVDGLLGSITQSGSTLNFLIDNLGNIVQEVLGGNGQQQASQIVGNYQNNMTYTGKSQQLQNGFIQKTYSYGPLNALVNIVFNSDGQIVQAVVVKQPGNAPGGGGGKGGSPPSNRPGGVSQGQGQAPPRAQPPQQAQGQAPPQGQAPQQVQGQAPPRAQAPPQAQAPAPAQAQAPAPAPAQAQVSAQAP